MSTPSPLPVIHIKHNRLLDPIFVQWTRSYKKWDDVPVPDNDTVKERVAVYRKHWKPLEKTILRGLEHATSLSFYRNFIRVNVVSLTPRGLSEPLVIRSGFEPDNFINTLTHELVHVLLTDEDIRRFEGGETPPDDRVFYAELYPDESSTTRSHIYVHAVLAYIYLDILNEPDRLEKNKDKCLQDEGGDYTRAWEIVEERGYKEILQEIQEYRG